MCLIGLEGILKDAWESDGQVNLWPPPSANKPGEFLSPVLDCSLSTAPYWQEANKGKVGTLMLPTCGGGGRKRDGAGGAEGQDGAGRGGPLAQRVLLPAPLFQHVETITEALESGMHVLNNNLCLKLVDFSSPLYCNVANVPP